MKLKLLPLVALSSLLFPLLASAQAIGTVPDLFDYVLNLINGILVPVIFAIAFLMFLVGVYRYFISGGGNPEKVQEGQKFVMWSLIGFFVMFSIWGLVNILINTLGFGGASMPDIPTFTGGTAGAPYYAPTTAQTTPSPTTAASVPLNGSIGNNGSCAGNPSACMDGFVCASNNSCVAIPGNGTRTNGQSCLGNINACQNGLTCATQSGDVCLPSSNSGASDVTQCPDGTTVDTAEGQSC